MHAVVPKLDCPHVHEVIIPETVNVAAGCSVCQDSTENWQCLICHAVCCSRYVNSHMAEHNASTSHSIAISFSDLSFWCYTCDSYIAHPSLDTMKKLYHISKFGYDDPAAHRNLEAVTEDGEEDSNKA